MLHVWNHPHSTASKSLEHFLEIRREIFHKLWAIRFMETSVLIQSCRQMLIFLMSKQMIISANIIDHIIILELLIILHLYKLISWAASKWLAINFIYNYIQNCLVYTILNKQYVLFLLMTVREKFVHLVIW